MYTTPLMVSSVEPSIASVRRNKDWSAGLLQHPLRLFPPALDGEGHPPCASVAQDGGME